MPDIPEIAQQEPSRLYRWSVLVFISITVFGSYLAYDCIGPIAPMLKEKLCFDSSQIGLLYSIYSIPNIIMVFFGGYIIDRIGTRMGGLLYASTVLIGVTFTALAPVIKWMPPFIMQHMPHNFSPEFIWMLLGRFIFGIGSESLVVAQTTIIAKWFKGKELALAFGINLTISRLGTFAAFTAFGWIAEHFKSIQPVFWASTMFCLIALLSFIVYVFMEKHALKSFNIGNEGKQEKIALSDIFRFPVSFFYISALCVLFYSSIFPFTSFSTDFFHEKWKYSQTHASQISSIIILFSMIFTPIFGCLIDRYGKRATVMIFGSLMLIPTYIVMGYTYINPEIPMSFMGIAFSLVPAAMWASVPLIIEEKNLGTAYGLMTMIQNTGLAIVPYIIGHVRDATGGYTQAMLIFSLLGVFGLIFSILLLSKERNRLELGSVRRNA